MIEKKVPFKRMIFVCTNVREGEAACGNADRGESCGGHLLEILKDEVKKRGLKGKIRVARSGCLDMCAQGPAIMIFDEQGAYTALTQVTVADIPKILDKFASI